MRGILKTAATLALVTSVPGFVSAAFAHGGSYRGPAGEVPPDSREPSDPPPPPEGGGPQTPGGESPGGPTTGGPDAGGPKTPGGGSGGPSTGGGTGGPTTGGGGGGAPSTGGKPKGTTKGAGYEDWTFWWNYNKDEILQLKSAVKKMQRGPQTGSSSGLLAAGRKSGQSIKSATDESIQKEIVPLLRHLLDGEKDVSFHIQSAAELGLAKIGDESIVETLKKMALNDNKAFHREVQETAGLAFGLLQKDTPEIRSFLIEMMKDQSRDATYLRPFSAISLGLLGEKNDKDGATIAGLMDIVSNKETKDDVKPAALTALGLLKNDAVVAELYTVVTTRKSSAKGADELNDNDLSYAIAALGKIGKQGLDKPNGETAVIDEMINIVNSKAKVKRSTNERRSAAIALGQIGPNCDLKTQKRVVDVLKGLSKDADDTQEKNFAIIALGRLGAAKGVDEKLRTDTIIPVLREELEKGRGLTPPFAALALGLIGRSYADEGRTAPEEEIRAPIRKKFDEEKGDPKSRGAYAVASGLVRDILAVDKLKEVLAEKGADKRVRGYCALGLGMIGAGNEKVVEAIKNTLKNDTDRDLRVQTAMAAGLLGDASVIENIVTILRDKDASNYELGSAALALGQIGDETAIPILIEIAKDEKKAYPDLTRALATVALGQIGDRRDIPTLARVATDINYRAHVPSLNELLTIL